MVHKILSLAEDLNSHNFRNNHYHFKRCVGSVWQVNYIYIMKL